MTPSPATFESFPNALLNSTLLPIGSATSSSYAFPCPRYVHFFGITAFFVNDVSILLPLCRKDPLGSWRLFVVFSCGVVHLYIWQSLIRFVGDFHRLLGTPPVLSVPIRWLRFHLFCVLGVMPFSVPVFSAA